MHKLKRVHDALKVLQFPFHPNHCIHCSIWPLIYHSKSYIHNYHNAYETMNRFSIAQSHDLLNQKKHSNIMHKQPQTYQR